MPTKTPRSAKPRISAAQIRREFEDTDPALMEAIVAGCAIVAYADGWVTDEEQRRMRGLIRRFEPVAAFGMADVLDVFDKLSQHFVHDHDAGEAFALAQVARLCGLQREANLLIETCCSIAEADGGFDSEERAAIIRMCEVLAIAPEDHGL